MRGIKKRGVILLLCCIILISTLSISFAASFASAADVAYIYNKDFKIDQNVIGVFNDLGLSVDTIKASQVSSVDFSQYRLIFVGDEKFSNPRLIPVNDYPSIIANYYHGRDWDITDADGISKIGGTQPLKVKKFGNFIQILQVYTDAFFSPGSTVAIPYYYLDHNNKAPGFEEIAGTHVGDIDGDLGAVIAYANASSRLNNGEFANGKMCFYGIIESDFWTSEAKQLFNECASFVATACSNDNDCDDDSIGDPYCDGKKIFRDNLDYSCQNSGRLDAVCIGVPQNKTFVQECSNACFNGGCVECNIDSDCDDNNAGTIDQCKEDHTCEYIPIPCSSDSDCNDNNNRTVDECVNPGDEDSFCRNTEVNCLTNSDCGFTGFLDQEFCSADDVFKNFQNSTCISPGTLQSNCAVTQTQQQVNECGEDSCSDVGSRYCSNNNVYQNRVCTDRGCSSNNNSIASCVSNPEDEAVLIQTCQFGCNNGVCLNQPACSSDADCNDNNAYTQDICLNPSTPQAQCVHNPLQCINNQDCNDNNALTIDQCINHQCNYTIIECNSNADCDDNNPQTSDQCLNPGTPQSQCVNTPLQCINNAQCGNPSSQLICSGNNVVNMTQTPQCISSNCSVQFANITLQNCQYGCVNGACLPPNIECDDNNDCNDNNPYTQDICLSPGTPQSQCIHNPIPPVCGNGVKESGEQCDDGNTANGDGCSSTCLLEGQICTEICSGGAVDFELVFDRSGSMNRYLDPPADSIFQRITKIKSARDAASKLAEAALNKNSATKIGLSTFSTDAVSEVSLTNNFNTINAGVLQLYANGNADTNYNESIIKAVDKLVSQGRSGAPNVIIFLSDGAPTVANSLDTTGTFTDPTDIESSISAANYAKSKNVMIVTVGFGRRSEVNEQVLKDMAQITNGQYFFVDNYNGIIQLYENLGNNTCELVCVNQTIECNNDLDCNDNNQSTQDQCVNNQCFHNTIICFTNTDCNDNNAQTTDICVNPSTPQSYCRHDLLQCINNAQCGSVASSLICSGSNVVNRTITPICTASNTCSQTTTNNIVQSCQYGCSNGACIIPNIECSNDGQCDDNNVRTADQCVNPATPQSFCINTEVNCLNNLECGVTGFIDGEFCSLNDVYKTFQNASCLSPGTLQSSCRITQTQQLIQDCNDNNPNTADSCSNGICINTQIGECNNDLDCNDNNQSTQDQCVNNQCFHNTIICFTNTDCNDNNAQTTDICVNPSTPQSYCRHDLLQCINNTQCGSQSSQVICSGYMHSD
ncbi:VWA domain-containing protein [Candidatus Pacearchaeota archaeon]|nr:VWA domain-containing protein [Candidatus Pacearchaeota archaeon]